MDPLKPSMAVLCKIGSALVHLDEARGVGGHVFDMQTFKTLMNDPEVREWLGGMGALALIPLKRIDFATHPPPARRRAKK